MVQMNIDGTPDLQCGSFEARYCYLATLYLVLIDLGPSIEVAGDIQLTASTEPIATTLLPGTYEAVVAVERNLYVKSIRTGAFDLAKGSLVIHQGQPPAPIEVELAPAAGVDGVVRRKGKRVASYVYALAEEDTAGGNFRLFAPVESKPDGTFELAGLAPGSWTIFASDADLGLDVRDPSDTAYWRSHGTKVQLRAGSKAHIVVHEAPGPPR